MMRNAPYHVEDCPTQRFTLTAPAVRRMFDEARVVEQMQAIEDEQRREQLRAFAVTVALWML